MSRIIVQSFCWNCAQFIAAPLLAVHNHVDEIQCFDGAFKFMKDAGYTNVPHSTDGTEDVIASLKLKCNLRWIRCTNFYENEIAKKMFMQQRKYWKPGEWKYLLSDDEIPSGNIKKAFNRIRKSGKALVAYVRMWEPYLNKKLEFHLKYLGWKPRFLKWQKGLHWQGKHYQLYNAKGIHRDKWPKIALTKMAIIHMKHCRFPSRLNMQLNYEKLGL